MTVTGVVTGAKVNGELTMGENIAEAVSQLMTYDTADRPIVHSRIGIRVEHRRLQDAGRKHDVAERTIVGIIGPRGHEPVRHHRGSIE